MHTNRSPVFPAAAAAALHNESEGKSIDDVGVLDRDDLALFLCFNLSSQASLTFTREV